MLNSDIKQHIIFLFQTHRCSIKTSFISKGGQLLVKLCEITVLTYIILRQSNINLFSSCKYQGNRIKKKTVKMKIPSSSAEDRATIWRGAYVSWVLSLLIFGTALYVLTPGTERDFPTPVERFIYTLKWQFFHSYLEL